MSQQEEIEQARKACVLCGNEFTGSQEVCPDDGTLLTPIGKEPRVGDIIADRYEILGILGDGGMGKVYKARHNLMKRIVAIKMLLPHLVQSGPALKRFQQEAQAASALKHPHIMTVHDFGISDKGLPFLVMDYLEGVSLSSVIQELGSLPQDRAVNIFIQACSALSHAHKNGVVHRDLKPANLMLIDFDGQPDFLMVVDFGIAKLLQPDEGGEQLTHTGEVFGSPLYMSPEQCRGRELDPRSDIYSLGCVVYRTVTGRPVFGGRDAMECMFKQVNDMPSSFGDICPEFGLSERLEKAVFKAIEKDPDKRFQTMAEFRDALEEVKGPAPPVRRVFSVPPQSGQEVAYDIATDRLRRAPNQLAATQLSANPQSGPPPEPNSSTSSQQAMPPAASSPGSISLSANTIPPPGSQNQAAPGSPQAGYTQAQTGQPGPGGSQPYSQGGPTGPQAPYNQGGPSGSQAQYNQGGPSGSPGQYSQTESTGPQANQNQDEGPGSARQGSFSRQGIQSARQSHDDSSGSGRQDQSGNRKMLAIGGGIVAVALIVGIGFVSMSGRHDKKTSSNSAGSTGSSPKSGDSNSSGDSNGPNGSNVLQAKSLIASSNYQNAELALNKAVSSAGGEKELLDLLPLQARVFEQSGKYAQAQDAWSKLLSLQEKNGSSKPDIARTKSQLALPMIEQGNVDQAEPLLNDAEKTLSSAPEADKSGLSHVYYGLSKVALKRGDYNQAVETLEQAISRLTRVEGADDPELVQFWQDLAEVYLVQGKLVDSEVALAKMLKMAEERFGKDSAQAADAYKDFGTVYFQKGNLGKSESYFKKALLIKSKDFGNDSVSAAEVMAALAMLYTREKKYKLAEPLFKNALAIRTRELGADSPQAKRSHELYATFQKISKGSR